MWDFVVDKMAPGQVSPAKFIQSHPMTSSKIEPAIFRIVE
jgi:hypothetical protein